MRKVIEIFSPREGDMVALCDDGTIWFRVSQHQFNPKTRQTETVGFRWEEIDGPPMCKIPESGIVEVDPACYADPLYLRGLWARVAGCYKRQGQSGVNELFNAEVKQMENRKPAAGVKEG